MKLNFNDIGGTVVKEDDRYVVTDNNDLNNLVLSSTELKPNKATNGHDHSGQEEIYMFIRGSGRMTVGHQTCDVRAGDIVPIQDGKFHKVEASDEGVYFICVFDGSRHTEDPAMIDQRSKLNDMYSTKGI
jgi:mannose-6-phosphate isomerase-like protein (cupin superfamily)